MKRDVLNMLSMKGNAINKLDEREYPKRTLNENGGFE